MRPKKQLSRSIDLLKRFKTLCFMIGIDRNDPLSSSRKMFKRSFISLDSGVQCNNSLFLKLYCQSRIFLWFSPKKSSFRLILLQILSTITDNLYVSFQVASSVYIDTVVQYESNKRTSCHLNLFVNNKHVFFLSLIKLRHLSHLSRLHVQ